MKVVVVSCVKVVVMLFSLNCHLEVSWELDVGVLLKDCTDASVVKVSEGDDGLITITYHEGDHH